MKRRRASFKRFLSRRAIEHRLGRRLFAEPWQAHDGLYWVKYWKPESLVTVVVLPDRIGQQTMQTATGSESLYESLQEAVRSSGEAEVIRRLKSNEVVVFDFSEDSDQTVVFDVGNMDEAV